MSTCRRPTRRLRYVSAGQAWWRESHASNGRDVDRPGGLGCQNPVSDLPPVLPDVRQSAGQPSGEVSSVQPATTGYTAPAPYPATIQDPSGVLRVGRTRIRSADCVRNTFCSFFIGRDPGIPTAREIEAAYYGGHYNQ